MLRGIDLTVDAGEIVAVLGSNGVGKSTLNRAISGIVRARAGAIRFDGADDRAREAGGDRRARAYPRAGRPAHLPQSVGARESRSRQLSPRRARAARKTASACLRSSRGCTSARAQRAGTLSGGEQQMLAIGRGLMAEPKLLILDEPSLGLSPLLVEEMFALIARINADGVAVLLVEQNVVQSLEIANRAYILAEGKFVMSGSAADIAADPELKRAYLGL